MRPPDPTSDKWIAGLALVIALLGCAVYLGSLRNDFTYDDTYIIPNNPVVTGDGGLKRIFTSSYWAPDDPYPHLYRPLTILSYWAQYRIAGLAPWSYHLVNVLIHGLVTGLVFFLCRRLASSVAAAAGAAILFAVHPIHSEAVVGTVGRADLLAACFVMGAWYWRERIWLAASLFACGLLSKENAIILPGLMIVEDLSTRAFRGRWRTLLSSYLALCGVIAAVLAARFAILGPQLGAPNGPFSQIPAAQRILTAVDVLGRYLWLMIYPSRLSADYEFNQIPVVTTPVHAGFQIGVAAIVICAMMAWLARRSLPPITTGLAIFFLALLPVSNFFFGIGTVMAERLLYLPSVGLCLAAGAILETGLLAAGAPAGRRLVAAVCLAAMLPGALFAARCWNRTNDWRDQLTLFEATVRTSPHSTLAWLGLGYALEGLGRLPEAEAAYRRSISIAPLRADSHFNLAKVLERENRRLDAVAEYEEAIRINPGFWRAHASVGVLYQELMRLDDAEAAYRRAVELGPPLPDPLYDLATVLEAKGRYPEAIEAYREALRISPDHIAALNNLGNRLASLNRGAEAIPLLERAVALGPDHPVPLSNLGAAYLQVGDRANAKRVLLRALAVRPDDKEARQMLESLR